MIFNLTVSSLEILIISSLWTPNPSDQCKHLEGRSSLATLKWLAKRRHTMAVVPGPKSDLFKYFGFKPHVSWGTWSFDTQLNWFQYHVFVQWELYILSSLFEDSGKKWSLQFLFLVIPGPSSCFCGLGSMTRRSILLSLSPMSPRHRTWLLCVHQ